MYKKTTDRKFEDLAKKYSERKINILEQYRNIFEKLGYGFEYELKFEEEPLYGKIQYESVFWEVNIFDPQKKTEERYLPKCSKKIRLFLLKYLRHNDNIYYRAQVDFVFNLIMKFWRTKALKKGEMYICSEHISDLFIRCYNPFRSGTHGGSYKDKNPLLVIVVISIILTLVTSVMLSFKKGQLYEHMGWW